MEWIKITPKLQDKTMFGLSFDYNKTNQSNRKIKIQPTTKNIVPL